MKGKHLAAVCLITALSLLAFVFSSWMRPLSLQADEQQVTETYKFLCVVPSSSSVYLAKVKPRIVGFGASTLPALRAPVLSIQRRSASIRDHEKIAISNLPRPLWLLNRSMLI